MFFIKDFHCIFVNPGLRPLTTNRGVFIMRIDKRRIVMLEYLVLLVIVALADVFYCKVIRPWIWRRPVKGAFVKPRS